MIYTTQAIVLKKIPAGEADATVTLYTRDFGKMHAYVQGVKKEEAKLKGHIEPISMSMVQFVEGVYGARLTYAQMVQPWLVIRDDFNHYGAAAYITELIDRHCLAGERDHALWELLIASFAALAQHTISPMDAMENFEKEFIHSMGYGKDGDMHILGGEKLARPVDLIYSNSNETSLKFPFVIPSVSEGSHASVRIKTYEILHCVQDDRDRENG